MRKFTEDVPREKVLRVVSVMEAPAAGETPGELRVPGDALIEDVAEDVLGQSLPVGVVDGSGALVGVLHPSHVLSVLFGASAGHRSADGA